MRDMWAPWEVAPALALLAMLVFALTAASVLSLLAHRLPRGLDALLAEQTSRAHRRYRIGFWLACPVLAGLCAWYFGPTPAAVAGFIYMAVLLALAWIDAETGLLPDMLSLPLLWLGLLVNLHGTFTPLQDAVLGAVAGYLMLWGVCRLFWLFTGRTGMGHGDFKLLAAMGAWVGWAFLPWIVLTSSSFALAVGLTLRWTGRLKAGDPLYFGPYLAGAGILALLL